MNWLAHLLLSEPDSAFRLGNIMPDLLRLHDLQKLPAKFGGGIARHRQIDSFADSHAVVRRSVARLQPPFRRYGNALVDVFYDHFLTTDWNEYSMLSREEMVREFYHSFDSFRDDVSPETFRVLERMREENWLGSYEDFDGIETTLRRMSFRLRRPFALHESVEELKRNLDDLHEDFQVFFPQLVAHVGS